MSTQNAKKSTARARSQEIARRRREQELKKQKQKHVIMGVAGAIIVGLLVTIILVAVNKGVNGGGGGGEDVAAGTGPVPAAATADGAIAIGSPDAPVTLTVYQDYICPYCGLFERTNGADIHSLVDDGTLRVELHVMSFLDQYSQGTQYSTRAANALATVADREPDQVLSLNWALFNNQPEENTQGLSDAKIASLAAEAGVSQEVIDTFGDRVFAGWVQDATQAALDSGVHATPTIRINGEDFTGDFLTQGVVADAINAAAQAKAGD